MHRGLIIAAAAAATLTAACATGRGTPDATAGTATDATAARMSLHAQEAAFLAALAQRDLDRTASFFADDAVLHVANMPPLQGRAAVHRFYGNVFQFMQTSAPASELVRVAASGDLGYSMGRVTNVFAGEGGPVEYAGKYLLVWERHGSEWRIATYSISSNQPETRR
jgi:ketosteroid isomerase-like protein